MKKAMAIALLIVLVCSGAMAEWKWKTWKGHHTQLFDAQNACTNIDSLECEPFLATAVAVSDVFHEIANPPDAGGKNFTVVFENMSEENCSQNWRRSMNGPILLHSALGLPVSSESAKSIYFVSALIRAARQLCHS
jgi:hypothetical protein